MPKGVKPNISVSSRGEPMSPTTEPGAVPPLTPQERLDLANQLYREFHTRCFWHCPLDLVITEDLVPMVVQGLRQHGGRRGFILSGRLRQRESPPPAQESPACHQPPSTHPPPESLPRATPS